MLFGFFILTLVPCFCHCQEIHRYPLMMPGARPDKPDAYLCSPVRVNFTKNYFIVGFDPEATMNIAHHIIIYGCEVPGNSDPIWNCGEMADASGINYNPCSQGSQVIYAWARDAPALNLPEGVGFKVGGDSSIQYLVLQVHYLHVDMFRDGQTDSSGVNLLYTETPLPKLAGVLLLGTGGRIDPMQVEYMETACEIKEDKVLHPVAFRTHTHSLGKLVSGYLVRNVSNNQEWTLLGKRNPMDPQMFYPVTDDRIEIRKGDILAARCTMHSNRTRATWVGGTSQDEMCNFYLIYWVQGGEPLAKKYCFSSGPPSYHWGDEDFDIPRLANIPPDASEPSRD